MNIFDTHCHVYYDDFNEDRQETIERALEAGVKNLMFVGTDLEVSKLCLEYAKKYDFVYSSAGIHPHDVSEIKESDFAGIEKLLEESKVKAIGEIGLDFFRDHSPKEKQEEIFNRFLEIYRKHQKPLIIHSRDAFDRILDLLRNSDQAPYQGIFHCFTGDKSIMKECLDLGFHISFSGILTYKRNEELREACSLCPKDRILIETDAPYLPPQSKRGKRNEPAFIVETAEMGAKLHQMPLEDFCDLTTHNAKQIFGVG